MKITMLYKGSDWTNRYMSATKYKYEQSTVCVGLEVDFINVDKTNMNKYFYNNKVDLIFNPNHIDCEVDIPFEIYSGEDRNYEVDYKYITTNTFNIFNRMLKSFYNFGELIDCVELIKNPNMKLVKTKKPLSQINNTYNLFTSRKDLIWYLENNARMYEKSDSEYRKFMYEEYMRVLKQVDGFENLYLKEMI